MSDSSSSRLDEIETVLYWEGQIDNARIRELLGVKTVWASRLLAELIVRMKGKVLRPRKHGPVILEEHLARKRSSPTPYLKILGRSPLSPSQWTDARIDLTTVCPAVFSAVHRAIELGVGIRISYRSMSNPKGSARVVYPHTVVRAPRRLHLRGWCAQSQDFRDFVLARIQSAAVTDDPAPHSAAADMAWNRDVELTLVPHPALTPDQQTLIADEFFPGARARKLRVKEALAGYVVQDLRLATNLENHRPPEYQLFLANPPRSLEFFA